jgi:hypothetical protein
MGGFKNEQDATDHLDQQLDAWPNMDEWELDYSLVQNSTYGWRCEFKLVQEGL